MFGANIGVQAIGQAFMERFDVSTDSAGSFKNNDLVSSSGQFPSACQAG
jgi:hypothetical protein